MSLEQLFGGPEQISLESLDRQHRIISLESTNLSQTLSAVTDRLPGFLVDVKHFITNTMNPFASTTGLVNSHTLEARLRNVDFLLVAGLAVDTPPGFRAKWLDYIQALNQGQAVLDIFQATALKPFETWLGTLINSPDLLRSVGSAPSLMRYKAPDLDGIKAAMAKCFDPKSGDVSATVGDVVSRSADIPVVTRQLNDINSRFATIDRKVLIRQVTAITELLDALIAGIKEDPEGLPVSGATLKTLTEMTFNMAREVEFYSAHAYAVESFTQSVKDSYKRLEKVAALK